jgi:hypothetical protein
MIPISSLFQQSPESELPRKGVRHTEQLNPKTNHPINAARAKQKFLTANSSLESYNKKTRLDQM